jgi:predicted dehydrogenase
MQLLRNRRHIFVEKPMTDSAQKALEMVQLAKEMAASYKSGTLKI